MTPVNKFDIRSEMSLLDIVKYQIFTYCYFEKKSISEAAATCFAHLCLAGNVELSKFCEQMSDSELFSSPQVVRNTILNGAKLNLVIKKGDHRKKVCINPALKIIITGNILLDHKFFHRESA